MKARRVDFRWKTYAVATLAIASFHWFAVPAVLMPILERKEAPMPMEVAFVADVDETADPFDARDALKKETDAPDEETEKEKEKERRRREREKRHPELSRRDAEKKSDKPPEPEKEKEPKPLAKPEPPKPPPLLTPPPIPEISPHQIFVDQDKFPDEADNADAKYLGQKNHRAKEEKVARNTNLAKNQEGPTENASAPSDNKQPEVGSPDQKIAELENRKGAPNQVVRSQVSSGDEGKSDATRPGKLSMRGLVPHAVDKADSPTPREGLELSDKSPGTLPMARTGEAAERQGSRARGERSNRPNLTLSTLDYDKIAGEGVADRERKQAARAEVSHAPGRWDKLQKKLAMMRSSLENFVPLDHTGNESELGTRAHPFAAYIAEMHRSIHKLWAFSFLASLDSKGIGDPLNDMSLITLIGIVLGPDGVVERVVINRPSGYAPFDAAAMDAVVSSSPFPAPPESIKSVDGKVYLDWTFHRDDNACGPAFVYPHILTTAPVKHASLRPPTKM